MATAGAISSSDDAKDTAVEDGIPIPNFFEAVRVETVCDIAGNTRDDVDPGAEWLST